MKFKLHYNKNFEQAFKVASRKTPIAARRAMLKATDDTMKYIRDEKLGGKPLYSRTGELKNSLQSDVKQQGDNVYGIIGTDIRWARVHELGAVITPTTSQYLRFPLYERGTGTFLGWKTVEQVKIPQRQWLKPVKKERHNRIKEILGHTFNLELKREIMREMRGKRFKWGAYSGT